MHGAGRHRALEVTLAGVALAVALAHGLAIPVTGEQRQCDQCVEQTINHRGLSRQLIRVWVEKYEAGGLERGCPSC